MHGLETVRKILLFWPEIIPKYLVIYRLVEPLALQECLLYMYLVEKNI